MTQAVARKPAPVAKTQAVKPSGFAKRIVTLASTRAVLSAHGHTLRSATKLKDKLDRQLAHAGGK